MVYTDGKVLVADSLEELHDFAKKSGLKRELFAGGDSRPHYDVSQNRVRVIDGGARYTKDRRILDHTIDRCLGASG